MKRYARPRRGHDQKRLAYVVIGHLEAEEYGGMDRFVADAPLVLVARNCASVNLAHSNYRGGDSMRDGDVSTSAVIACGFWKRRTRTTGIR